MKSIIIKDIKKEILMQVNDLSDIDKLCKYSNCETVGGKIKYLSEFGTYDTETTSLDKTGYVYLFQICIGEDVFMFRRWEEFLEFYRAIVAIFKPNRYKRLVVYVHNLAFEFQFMRNFFRWDEIFAVKKRVPVKVTTKEGVEFRCSYKLTNMSLLKFLEKTEGVVHYKQSGEDYDYSIIRTCDTVLTDNQYYYAYCDVKGLHEGIETLLKEDTLATIPLTSTGYVRRDARKAVLSNSKNRTMILNSRITPYLYLIMRTARRGGLCGANPYYCGQLLEGLDSWDIKSSYPYIMLTHPFPVGEWIVDSGYNRRPDRHYLMKVEYVGISVKDIYTIGYISKHKVLCSNGAVNCNGRVLKAQKLTVWITEVDLEIIETRYDVESYNILEAYSCESSMLPREFREVVYNYFKKKCEFEGVDDYLYAKSKNKLNALFGMMLTDITHSEITLENGEWEEVCADVTKALDSYFKSRNSFLLYQWGLYVTAYARKRLNAAYVYKDNRRYCVYDDTDSWKLSEGYHKEFFLNENDRIMAEKDSYDVPISCVNSAGKLEVLGVWEYEGKYEKFKTLGAKKYCTVKKGKLTVTVSGLSKEKGSEYLSEHGGIEAFNDNFTFPEKHSGRTVSYYDDCNDIKEITVNGATFTTSSSIAIHDTTYTLDRQGEYVALLEHLHEHGLENIS